MGLSNRKRTNRRFNGTKMVTNNIGVSSTIVPKNEFSDTNQYRQIPADENNFIPCTTNEGLYDETFRYQQTGNVNVCVDENPFYGKNKLILGRNIGTSVVDSRTGELLYNNSSLSAVTSVIQLPLNQYLVVGNFPNLVEKVNSDLTIDNSLYTNFTPIRPINRGVSIHTPDNKIIIYLRAGSTPYKVGYLSTLQYYQQIYKLDLINGIDLNFYNQQTFGFDSTTQFFPASTSYVNCMEIIPTNNPENYKVYIGGSFNEYQELQTINFCSIDQIGGIDDERYSPFTDITKQVTSIKHVGNGMLLIGGYFTDIEGYDYILRYDTNGDGGFGIVDTNFVNPDIKGPVTSISLDSDGKIIVSYNNTDTGTVQTYVRLNSDGSVDETFNVQNFVADPGRPITTNFIYKSNNGGYFLRGSLNDFENGNQAPSFIKLKGC